MTPMPNFDQSRIEAARAEACWTCKIGPTVHAQLPSGADLPMREAVAAAFKAVTGHDCEAIFSGWGGRFREPELAVIEYRLPDPRHPDIVEADALSALTAERAENERLRAQVAALVAVVDEIRKADVVLAWEPSNARKIIRRLATDAAAALAKAKQGGA